MTPNDALLALIADLYLQINVLRQENAQLRATAPGETGQPVT